MNSMFHLALLGFLLMLGMGCTTSRAPITPMPSVRTVNTFDKQPALLPRYEDEVLNSPLARYKRGELRRDGTVQYRCCPTGRFNVGSDGTYLLMEAQCSEASAPSNRKATIRMKEVKARQMEGETRFFQTLFKGAIVSVGGSDESDVRLHYRDKSGKIQNQDLPALKGGKYMYSFAKIAKGHIIALEWFEFL